MEKKLISIIDFSDLNGINKFEKAVLARKYKGVAKTDSEWRDELNGKITSSLTKEKDEKPELDNHKGIPLTPEAQKEFDKLYPKQVVAKSETKAAAKSDVGNSDSKNK